MLAITDTPWIECNRSCNNFYRRSNRFINPWNLITVWKSYQWTGSVSILTMLSYQYRDYHYKDKTVWRPSYLYNGNPHTWIDGLYTDTGPWYRDLPVSRLFTQPFVQAQIKENIKAPRHWPLWGNSLVTPHKGPVTRKVFPFDDVIMTYLDVDPIIALFFGHEIQLFLVHAGMLTRPVVRQEQPEQEPQQTTTTWRVQWMWWHMDPGTKSPTGYIFYHIFLNGITIFWFNFHWSFFLGA